QGGDPIGNGTGGPGYRIKGEFSANGVKNPLKHERGVLSMARAQHPDSAGSQFFVMHADADYLDGQYAAFGRVIEGMETVDAIANAPTDFRDRPKSERRLKKVTAETFGVAYPEPETM
ncbi:MAG: peptidylprolyl isomerase, partial [Candidatus Gallimonas sp.]